MKILITGANSYIGTSFEKWVTQYPDKYNVETVDMISGIWRNKDFTSFDVVYHVAGIVHIKETKKNADLYYRVNRDLVVETATKAKAAGVKQFIFLSSMSVYGDVESGIINKDTILKPKSNYGKSKLQAEEGITALADDNFKIAILRPPMIYGRGCKGNYQTLRKYSLKLPFFPDIKNKRSMIYVDNLSEFVRVLIDDEVSGIFYPQNMEYMCTSEMVRLIAEAHGKQISLTKIFNPILKIAKINLVNKVFGDLVYETDIDTYKNTKYCVVGMRQSIQASEKG